MMGSHGVNWLYSARSTSYLIQEGDCQVSCDVFSSSEERERECVYVRVRACVRVCKQAPLAFGKLCVPCT